MLAQRIKDHFFFPEMIPLMTMVGTTMVAMLSSSDSMSLFIKEVKTESSTRFSRIELSVLMLEH